MEALLSQARVQIQNQDLAGAIATLTACIEQDPHIAEAYYQRGVAYYRADNLHAAVSDYGKVLGIDPEHAKAYYARALARLSLENPTGAMTDISAAIQWNRDNPAAYQFRGRLHRQTGDRPAAIKDLKTAARMFTEQGKPDRAKDCIAAIEDLQAKPDPRKFTGALAPAPEFFKQIQTLIQWGDQSRAMRLLSDRLGKYPNEAEAYYYRGTLHHLAQRNEAAISDMNQALALGYKDANVYRSRAVTRLNLGDNQGAIADINQALALQEDAASYLIRGNVYRSMKHYLGAIEEYAEALSHEADSGEIYYERGLTYEAMGESPQAIADYQRAMSLLCTQEKWDAYKQVQQRLENLQNRPSESSPPETSSANRETQLYQELLALVGNNQSLAEGMIKRMHQHYPDMSREWCIESAINNVKRDMEL